MAKHREEVQKRWEVTHPCRKAASRDSFPLEAHPEGSEPPGSHLSTTQLGVPELWAPAGSASPGTTPCLGVSSQRWRGQDTPIPPMSGGPGSPSEATPPRGAPGRPHAPPAPGFVTRSCN